MADETAFGVVMLVFRFLLGVTFAGHGWAKRFGPGGLGGTAGWFESIGMSPGKRHAFNASTTEMAAGALLAVGLLTPFAAAGMVGVMVVAGWAVHRRNGFFIVSGGWEYTFVVGLIATAIAGFGPGRWSIDHAIGISDDFSGFLGVAIALVLGVGVGVAQLALFYRPVESTTAEA
jgi:putative oxidoreductase